MRAHSGLISLFCDYTEDDQPISVHKQEATGCFVVSLGGLNNLYFPTMATLKRFRDELDDQVMNLEEDEFERSQR